MINKYQAGGAAPQGSILQEIAKLPQDKQKQIMTAFGKWAQAKGLNIQQLQGNEQALEQAMGQFLQEMQQAPKARLGAKLNYVRSLRGLAPEGMEVEYYKEGGQVKKKFVKPAGGAKEKDGKKEIADFKKKKACGGLKAKFADGGKPKAKNWTKEDDKKLLKYRLKGTKNPAEKKDSTDVQTKWNKLPEKVKKQHEVQEEKCGGKAKKHMFGGIIGFQAGGSFKDAWNAARKNKLRYFNWNGKMYNSKDKGNDVAYESFRDNMNEASAQLPTDKSPKHLGWDRNNPTSNEMRGNDREIRQQGTESVLPGITVIGTRRQPAKKPAPNYQVRYNMPMGAIEYVGRDGKQYWMRQDHSTGQYLYTDRSKPISHARQVVPEGYIIPGANIKIGKGTNIGKIGLGLNKNWK